MRRLKMLFVVAVMATALTGCFEKNVLPEVNENEFVPVQLEQSTLREDMMTDGAKEKLEEIKQEESELTQDQAREQHIDEANEKAKQVLKNVQQNAKANFESNIELLNSNGNSDENLYTLVENFYTKFYIIKDSLERVKGEIIIVVLSCCILIWLLFKRENKQLSKRAMWVGIVVVGAIYAYIYLGPKLNYIFGA